MPPEDWAMIYKILSADAIASIAYGKIVYWIIFENKNLNALSYTKSQVFKYNI